MKRCASLLAALVLAAATTAQAAPQAAADGQSLLRRFPRNALRGTMTFGAPPQVRLNGQWTTFAPAYRVHGLDNLIMMSGQLTGASFVVDYTTDLQGQPYEVWLLSKAEIANQPWPETAEQAAAWTFDAVAQAWTKP